MDTKKKVLLLCYLAVLIIAGILIAINFIEPHTYLKATGKAVDIEQVNVLIREGLINITSPENKTYYFDNKVSVYALDLNVTSNFEVVSWWYTLEDLKHNRTVYDTIGFLPNTTINAARWKNRLTVYANSSLGGGASKTVEFFVAVNNSPPVIQNLDPEIFACEGNALSSYFNVTDVDEDTNIGPLESRIDPQGQGFYIEPVSYWLSNGENYTQFHIYSGKINKNNLGGANAGSKIYGETISVSDGEYADSSQVNITLIEINNAPSIENIGVHTKVWTKGENSTFYHQAIAADIEDGNQDSGNLTFNIKILDSMGGIVDLFDITSNGVMNFTPTLSQLGIYNISVCVIDSGIKNSYERILELCGQDGRSKTSCSNFSLTITNENRPPTITDYYPESMNFSAGGNDTIYFNVSMYDPDGTFLDTYWYIDDVLEHYVSGVDTGGGFSEFNYFFGCGVSGKHKVRAEVTDGLLNDSITWNLTIDYLPCPSTARGGTGGGSGGGGGGPFRCIEKWVCDPWNPCQNVEASLETGLLSREDYRNIKSECGLDSLYDQSCGFQIRGCFDINNCNTSYAKPIKMQDCLYKEVPSCHDKIKNCHDKDCEFLVDCGGPCAPCPTCSDNLKNQGEEGIDCGGPCPYSCAERPLKRINLLKYLLLILVVILLIIIAIKLFRIFEMKEEVKKEAVQYN